jgi:hypothetical protein
MIVVNLQNDAQKRYMNLNNLMWGPAFHFN